MSEGTKSDLRCAVVAAIVLSPSKTAQTKSVIKNTAMQCLITHQFRHLTVGGLMASAGYSGATFYQYFNDLHGLMKLSRRAPQFDTIPVARVLNRRDANMLISSFGHDQKADEPKTVIPKQK